MQPLTTTEPSAKVANRVADALSAALENGYDFKGWTDEQIADDMFYCGGVDPDMPRDHVIVAIHALRS